MDTAKTGSELQKSRLNMLRKQLVTPEIDVMNMRVNQKI